MPNENKGKWIWPIVALIIGFLIALLIFNGSGYQNGYEKGKASVVIPTCHEANFETCKAFCIPVNAQSCASIGLVSPEVCENQTIERDYVGQATEDFMDAVHDEDELQECGNETYDFDQIAVSKVYKSYSVEYKDADEYTVNFEIKLKYLDEDTNEKCYNIYDVSVFYEPDEEPVVSW